MGRAARDGFLCLECSLAIESRFRCSRMKEQLRLDIDESASLQALWSQVVDGAERRHGREAVESWLADAVPVALRDGALTLGVPNATARTCIEKKYGSVLAELAGTVHGTTLRLEVTVRKAEAEPAARPSKQRRETKPSPAPAVSPLFAPIPLNDK